jgi:hypothetical protein
LQCRENDPALSTTLDAQRFAAPGDVALHGLALVAGAMKVEMPRSSRNPAGFAPRSLLPHPVSAPG